ncbi:MAG TPA: hypothetical protein PK967_14855 [Candidatus Hydrogenedentes bacterium]|nr:hypothetical protein [Candidatus Hydrogenedentota bacterium]
MFRGVMAGCACLFAGWAIAQAPRPVLPQVAHEFGKALENLRDYAVVLEPDKNEPEWWAGAPSVARGKDGLFWMACRMRMAEAPRGRRGYEIRILRSADGVHFEKALSIRREDVPIPGFERPALVNDPHTGRFKLYACGPWRDGPWSIIKFADADTPDTIDPASAYPVIQPLPKTYDRDVIPVEYKDPFILHTAGTYHCYVIGYVRQNEKIFHFQSVDGEKWDPVGNPYEAVMPLDGWHDFFVRPACVVPIGLGWLFVYEGSSAGWYDPVYNIATGLGFTFDLHRVTDLTPQSPLLVSSTPGDRFATFRYSHWLMIDGRLWIYAEVARPNLTHEIRLYRVPIS